MKKSTAIVLILLGITGLIVLYPWFEYFLLGAGTILLGIYLHYWPSKSKYGPYLYYPPSEPEGTAMMVNWVGVAKKYQSQCSDCWVEYSLTPKFPRSQTNKIRCNQSRTEKERTYYHILIKNLEPRTTYYYRVGLSDTIIFSGKTYHFTTAFTPKDENYNNFKCIIYGDDQTADWIPVLAQTTNHFQYKEKPSFIIHLGDINQNLWHLEENNVFFTTKKKIFKSIPYQPVIGNHDTKPISQYDAFYQIPHWYSFNFGQKLKFICLTPFHSLKPNTEGQYEFIKNALEQTNQENRFGIICLHEGPFKIEQKIPEEEETIQEIRTYLVPLLHKYNRGKSRNLILFGGHVHSYEKVIKQDMTYITIGACSNGKYYSKLKNSANNIYIPEEAESEYGRQSYAVLSIKSNKLQIQIKGWFNKIIEELEFDL